MSVSIEWWCLSWWACARSKGSHNGDLHGWFTAAQANEEWSCLEHENLECFLAAMSGFRPDISKRSLRLSHPPVFQGSEQWYVLIRKTWSDFHFICKVVRVSLVLTECRVSILHTVMQYRDRFIQASMKNASLFLLTSLYLAHCRDGHSSTYYISEQLPLEACPVILVRSSGAMWCWLEMKRT